MRFVFKGLKKAFETAVVNEPSVFEPLKFYCTFHSVIIFSGPSYQKFTIFLEFGEKFERVGKKSLRNWLS